MKWDRCGSGVEPQGLEGGATDGRSLIIGVGVARKSRSGREWRTEKKWWERLNLSHRKGMWPDHLRGVGRKGRSLSSLRGEARYLWFDPCARRVPADEGQA